MKKNNQRQSILTAGAIVLLLAVVLLLDNVPGVSAMLVRALGYQGAASRASADALPFTDVTSNRGYIAVAYAIGMLPLNGFLAYLPSAGTSHSSSLL